MIFYSAALALVGALGGMLIYRLGISDGAALRKGETLFSKRKSVKDSDEGWQSIMSYDHRKKN